MTEETIVIAGCGRVGTRLGLALAEAGHAVHGIRRRADTLPSPLRTVRADVTDAAGLAARLPRSPDRVYIILTPARYDEDAYRRTYVDGVTGVLAALRAAGGEPTRVVLVSSTSVYGQQQGEWVDETSATEPSGFAGRCMLEAEARLADSPFPSTAVRFAGIYGPGRNRLLNRVREQAPCPAHPPVYTNRVHEDDVVGFLRHLQGLAAPESLYLGADDEPAPRHEVMTWLAGRMGVAPPPLQTHDGSRNKRCRNTRMRASGYQLEYPGYRDGYSALLAAE
jgi:nucleoside-diphosphate-sugar epimerase